MKKLLAFLPLLCLPVLSGCGSTEKVALTYGSYNKQNAIEITDSDFSTKLSTENFLLALYPENIRCMCWTNFQYVINKNVALNGLQIYQMKTKYINDYYYSQGFLRVTDSPTFYIVNKGKISRTYTYQETPTMFSDEVKFYEEIKNNCYLPKLFSVNTTELDELIQADYTNTLIMRHGCSDCSYVIPNVLLPYTTTHEGKMYVLDIEEFRPSSDDPEETKEAKTKQYQEIKDKYHLSDKYDSTYGYSLWGGVVPTFQTWSKGKVVDACVYLNDDVEEQGDNYVIKTSYYTEERITHLKYLGDVENKVLQSKIIAKAEYSTKIKEYHLPILTAYLDMYFK